jgi:hypothetical protein
MMSGMPKRYCHWICWMRASVTRLQRDEEPEHDESPVEDAADQRRHRGLPIISPTSA